MIFFQKQFVSNYHEAGTYSGSCCLLWCVCWSKQENEIMIYR